MSSEKEGPPPCTEIAGNNGPDAAAGKMLAMPKPAGLTIDPDTESDPTSELAVQLSVE